MDYDDGSPKNYQIPLVDKEKDLLTITAKSNSQTILGLANKTNQLRNLVKLPVFEYKKIKIDRYENKMRNPNVNSNQNTIFNMMTGNSTPTKGFSINNPHNSLNQIFSSGKRKQSRSKTPSLGGRLINILNTSSNTLIDVSKEGNNNHNNQISHKIFPKINENKNLTKNQSGLVLAKVSNHINNSFNLNNTSLMGNKKVGTPNNKNTKNGIRNLILFNQNNNNYTKKFIQKHSVDLNNSRKGDRLSNSKDRSLNNLSGFSNNSGPTEKPSHKNGFDNISAPLDVISKDNAFAAGSNLNINVSNVNINVNNNINQTGSLNNKNTHTSNNNTNNINKVKVINDDRKFSILDIGGNTPLYFGEMSENKNGNYFIYE